MQVEGIKGVSILPNIQRGEKSSITPQKVSQGDTLVISEAGRGAQEFEAYMKNISAKVIKEISDIRQDKVAEVKERLKTGYYSQPKVKEAVATRFLAQLAR